MNCTHICRTAGKCEQHKQRYSKNNEGEITRKLGAFSKWYNLKSSPIISIHEERCMKKVKLTVILTVLALFISTPVFATQQAVDLKAKEKDLVNDFRKSIPAEKIKNIDDLYAKWQEVQSGKSKAVIIDIRTEAEFDAGHIIGSSNIDSGHAYGLPKKIKDPNAEIWVFCRTKRRASYFVGMLYKYGYTNVYLAEGGIKAWAEKGYTLGNKYLGEIKVAEYHKKLKEDFWYRENK